MLSGLHVPIWAGGRVLGAISVESSQRQAFSETEELLLTTLASQAAAALENARLFGETQRRAAESLKLYEITRDLSAQVSLSELLDTLAAKAAALMNVEGGGAYLYEAEHDELVMTTATHPTLPVGTRLKLGEGMAGRVAESREPLIIDDYQAWAGRTAKYASSPFATVLEVPMVYRDELIGVLVAYTMHGDDPASEQQHRTFDKADAQLLSLFAASAAGAVYSARLFEAERARRREAETLRAGAVRSSGRLSILHASTREIARFSQDLEQVYTLIHRAASRLVPTEAFTITLLDEEQHQLDGVYLFDKAGRSPSMKIPFGQGFSSQVISRGETIVLSDAETAEYEAAHFGAPEHVRSILAVPLRVGGTIIGAISAQCYQPNAYNAEDQVLFEMLAAQAAIAIQNARLFSQAQQRAQQFQTLYAMANDVAVQHDIQVLLKTIIERAAELLHTARGGIYLYDAERGDVQSVVRVGDGIQPGVRLQLGEGAAGRVAQRREPILIDDYQSWSGRSPQYDGVPLRAVLQVPMLYGGELIGVLTVDEYGTDSTRKFSPEDVSLLSLFASHAAGVIYNARLFDQTRRRLHELKSLSKVSDALTGTLELESLLENILRSACQAIPEAEKGTILLCGKNGQSHLQVRAQVGYDDSLIGEYFDDSKGYSGRAFHEKRPLLIGDSQAEYEIPFEGRFEAANTVQSAIVAPLIVKDEAIGSISLDNARRKSAFDEADLRLLMLFASSTAVVIENARLFEETRQRAGEFETLYQTTRDIGSHQPDLSSLLPTLVERAVQLLGAYGGGVYLYDPLRNDLELAVGLKDEGGVGTRMKLGEGAAGRVAETRAPLVIDDYQTWDGRRPAHQGVPYRALLQVPMLYGGDLLGVIDVYEYGNSERKFTQEDVRLLSLFAAQAASAVHNARLFEETRKKANEFATLYDTASDLAHQANLNELLNTIVERAGLLLNAPVSGIYLYNESTNDLYVAVNRGFTSSLNVRLAMGEGVAGRVAQTRQPMFIEDHQKWEGRSPQYDGVSLRSVLEVPMLYSGELIGVLTVDEIGDSERKFTQDDSNLLSLFASQAAGAVYGARLLEQTRQRVEELNAIARVSAALRTASTRAEIVPAILAQLREVLHADGAFFAVLDEAAGTTVIQFAQGTLESLAGLTVPSSNSFLGPLIRSHQPYRVANAQEAEGTPLPYLPKNMRSGAMVPLFARDAALGGLGVVRDEKDGVQPPAFDEREVRILSAVGDIAANAIQRVSLYEQTTLYAEQLVTVNEMGHALSETLDLPAIYENVAYSALDLLPDTAGVFISMFDPQTRLITAAYALKDRVSINVENLPSMPLDESGEDNPSRVILSGKPIIVHDLRESSNDQTAANARNAGADEDLEPQAALYVPLKAEGRVIGVLQVQNHTRNRYTKDDAELLELVANTAAAAIQNSRLFSQLKQRVDQLSALHAVDTAIGSTTDLRVSLQTVLENITRQLQVDAADVLLLNSATLMLQYAAGTGFFTSEITRTSSSIGRDEAGRAALERRTSYIPDLTEYGPGFLRSNLIAAERFIGYAAVPLIAKGEVKGVLEIFHRTPLELDQERKSFLEMLAGQAALAVDNALLFDGLERANLELTMAYDATIEGWSQALELRDQETQGHSARVLELTLRLAAAMGISDKETQDIRRGVLLHDIGKMGIPDSILHKPGPLTDEEWEVMHKHPRYAYDMLAPIVYLRNSLDIPYAHHEKWDGSGYPRGLRGETIPMSARIFSVVDVYDALRSDRPYRPAWPQEKTNAYISEQAGKHFDPHVVDVFLTLIGS